MLGLGGFHVGSLSEHDAQAMIEAAQATVARATSTGRISILNDELTIRTGARSEKQRIESPSHLLAILDEHFGISLTEAPRYIWA